MAIASGINKYSAFKKQASGLGTPESGSGSTLLRRVTTSGTAPRDFFESNEITDHHQSTGVSYGLKRSEYVANGLLSAGTFAELFGSILEQDLAAGIDSTALTLTYGGSANAWTLTRSSGSFLTNGFKIGHVVRSSGGSVSANNSRNFLLTNVTALVLTFRALDGATVTSGSSTTTTVTVYNKLANAATSSHTADYYTIEDWYSDISKSELFADQRVGQIAVSMPATGNATVAVNFVGLSRTLGTSRVLTSPSATTTEIMNSSNGVILINGTAQTVATGINFTIANGAANAGAVIGSNNGRDVTTGRIRVSGTFTAQFDSTTLQALFDGETATSISVVLLADTTGASDFVAFTLPKVKITSDDADDGEKAIVRTYNFTAEYNADGGSGVSSEATIMTYQDSAAA